MKKFLTTIDDSLRGRLTRKEDLAAGKIEAPIGMLILAGLCLGGIYGLCMGLFAVTRELNPSYAQMMAAALKVPLLFILTLVVTYPSLYVVSAIFDSRLRQGATLRLLLIAMTANLAMLAGLAPVTAFFTASTESYPFMVVLNVFFLGVAGLVGLGFLRKALNAIFEVNADEEAQKVVQPADPMEQRIRPRPHKPASLRVFSFWILIYGCVGAQMGWVLRPFIGAPNLEFTFFRSDRDSNFFEAFFHALGKLFV